MGYYEFNIKIARESMDAFIEHMRAIGCLGVIDNESNIIAYFSDIIGIQKIIEGIKTSREILSQSGLDENISYNYQFIGERDWNESWKKRFRPIEIGESLAIIPPWEKDVGGRINIIIDPGMAFGTGHHETTRTCLYLIERLSKICNKGSLLDFGTGTGILAIAALKLGFRHAIGIDIDELAIEASERNARLNKLDNIKFIHGSITELSGRFDLIVANIISETLIQHASHIASLLNKNSYCILSGMIKGQETDVINKMESLGLYLLERINDERWITLVLRN